jgi:hypothetical protein
MELTNRLIVTGILSLLMLLATPGFAAQQLKSLLASANGKGSIKVGQEKFDLDAVVVKLMEDGKAEITLVSDITLFFSGTWSSDANDDKGIVLKITGGAASGGVQANGKLFLRHDGKSIASLSLAGSSKTRKRDVEVSFVAN